MNIEQLKKKPQLHQLTLDSEDILEAYGEPVTFWMRDYIDLSTYFEFYKTQQDQNQEFFAVLRKLILNEQGEPVIGEDEVLPNDIVIGLFIKINDFLGKSRTKSSTQKTGDVPA